MTINPQIFTWLIGRVQFIWTYLDNISIGGLFSLLDLGIVIVLAGMVLPSVLHMTFNAGNFAFGYNRDFNRNGG